MQGKRHGGTQAHKRQMLNLQMCMACMQTSETLKSLIYHNVQYAFHLRVLRRIFYPFCNSSSSCRFLSPQLPLIHHFLLPLLFLSAFSSTSSISPAVLRSGWGVNCLGAPQSLFLKEQSCFRAASYLCLLFHLTTLSHRRPPHFCLQ